MQKYEHLIALAALLVILVVESTAGHSFTVILSFLGFVAYLIAWASKRFPDPPGN